VRPRQKCNENDKKLHRAALTNHGANGAEFFGGELFDKRCALGISDLFGNSRGRMDR
jgi:hypothetical protein